MQVRHITDAENGERNLYRVGAIAILIAVVFFRRNFAAEMDVFDGFGIYPMPAEMPVSAADWFSVLGEHPLVGLMLLNLVDVINYLLVGIFFLALYAAFRRDHPAAALVATVLAWAGVVVYVATNQAFAMLALSEKYAAAPDIQQAHFLAAGEALLAVGERGSLPGLFLLVIAGLVISLVMLRSGIFNRLTAWSGIIANGVVLLYFIFLVAAPQLIAIPHVISAPFRILWYVLVALKLLRLSRKTTG